jgi:hypothetical protein
MEIGFVLPVHILEKPKCKNVVSSFKRVALILEMVLKT